MTSKITLTVLILLLASCGGESAPVVAAGEAATQVPTTQVPTTQATLPEVTTTVQVDDSIAEPMDEDMDTDGDEHATDESDHMMEMDHSATTADLADEGALVDRTIEVVMTEFMFDPGPIDVAAGETVEFVVVNEGAIRHEFRVTTQEDIDHHIAEGHSDHSEAIEPGVLVLDPGETGSLLVTFHEAGEFDMIACLIPTHFEAGMGTELNIKG